MGQTIDNAVGELIKRQQGTVSYTDNGREVVVTSKPAHYSVHVQLIDKEARKRKQSSVRLDKTYTYPKEIEQAVLWDMLLSMRQAIITYTGEQGCKSWDDTLGASWPQLLINKPTPEQEFSEPSQRKYYTRREKSENQSDRGFIFGAVKLRTVKKWQSYYRLDDGGRKHVGYFESSVEAKEAAYKAATEATDLPTTDRKANKSAANAPKNQGGV